MSRLGSGSWDASRESAERVLPLCAAFFSLHCEARQDRVDVSRARVARARDSGSEGTRRMQRRMGWHEDHELKKPR